MTDERITAGQVLAAADVELIARRVFWGAGDPGRLMRAWDVARERYARLLVRFAGQEGLTTSQAERALGIAAVGELARS